MQDVAGEALLRSSGAISYANCPPQEARTCDSCEYVYWSNVYTLTTNVDPMSKDGAILFQSINKAYSHYFLNDSLTFGSCLYKMENVFFNLLLILWFKRLIPPFNSGILRLNTWRDKMIFEIIFFISEF